MKNITLLATLTILTMTAAHSHDIIVAHSEKNIEINPSTDATPLLAQKGNKGNKENKNNQNGSNKSDSKNTQEKSKQKNSKESNHSNGAKDGGNNSFKKDQYKSEKQDNGNDNGGKHSYQNNESGKKGKNSKIKNEKGHPNHGYAYVNRHGYISHKNYGQWRSAQARNKHHYYHPVYEFQAREGFNLLIVRNGFLFSETDYKINLFNARINTYRDSNKLTLVEYNIYRNRIVLLQKRRAALEINILL